MIAAKNLARNRGSDEILRCAQNDGVFPPRERLQNANVYADILLFAPPAKLLASLGPSGKQILGAPDRGPFALTQFDGRLSSE
jgi:hypothetical protein